MVPKFLGPAPLRVEAVLGELLSPWRKELRVVWPSLGHSWPLLVFPEALCGVPADSALAVLGLGWGGRWPPSIPRPVPSPRHGGTSRAWLEDSPRPPDPPHWLFSEGSSGLEVPGWASCASVLAVTTLSSPHRAAYTVPYGPEKHSSAVLPPSACEGQSSEPACRSCWKGVQGNAPCAHPAGRSHDAQSVSKSKRHNPDIFPSINQWYKQGWTSPTCLTFCVAARGQ